ncbi:SLC13 family permease [Synoicihabitans lomoniglobus]|uniref:DASS family sodium-coupled anion symporter n=1 Tax=Synoicihabitans lomoniglobus TaxID=2909285 RepID=A0AAF0CMP4_9BACT|nr:DASS family sodium-coupled anion symporter [Opitutaceae bacterium LMO-M01]WED64443.1 DASS family sodium-coupled anion symporter [Opitutaceae bacterium LMO-M01]
MNAKALIGLALGIAGFAAAMLVPLNGLELSAQITLGIFVLAAVFWITEPIPIFATSMLVILLQVILLSSQGIVFSVRTAPLAETEMNATGALVVPATVINDAGVLYLNAEDKSARAIKPATIVPLGDDRVAVTGPGLDETARVIADPMHRSITVKSTPYATFYATLASPIIILFMGGFALAAAAVKFGLDLSLTRVLLKPFGTKPAFVCLGLMLCTGTLSAFMSNTATTAMMMTVVLPIVATMSPTDPFRKGIALAIPVAANIGGIATPIGTPPNAVALAALKDAGYTVSFSSWMMLATPFAIVMLVFAWWLLVKLFKPATNHFELNLSGSFNKSPKALISYAIFAITVLLWVTEKVHGISTSMVAFLPVALLPALGVLDKKDIRGFSWEVLWLMAGGISLGLSMKDTGLAAWLIGQVSWATLGNAGVVVVFGLVGFVLANLVSHTVSSTIIMPLAISVGATLAATGNFNLVGAVVAIAVIISLAMALPISTPPNAIAMSTGVIESKDLTKTGLIVGLVGVTLSVLLGLTLWPALVS